MESVLRVGKASHIARTRSMLAQRWLLLAGRATVDGYPRSQLSSILSALKLGRVPAYPAPRAVSTTASTSIQATFSSSSMTSTRTSLSTISSLSSSFPELSANILPSSATTVATLLSANHSSHHCFFNTRGMHNHSAHQLIADLTLSATPSQLEQHYDYQIAHYLSDFRYSNRSVYDPHHASSTEQATKIEKINPDKWQDHLGNARYYWSYLHFFDEQVQQLGFSQALEKYVLSRDANQANAKMLARFYGGVLHAWIHFGYALELTLNELAGEALAMASATAAGHAWLFDYDWLFKVDCCSGQESGVLELVDEIQQDERLSVQALRLSEHDSALPDAPFQSGRARGVIQSYVDRWSSVSNVEKALGELSLFSALLLGAVPRQSDQRAYKHDFFLMHLNNSHLFTPLLLDAVSTQAHKLGLLRGLLAQFFWYYVCRGRPRFSAQNWIDQYNAQTVLDWDTMFLQATQNVDEHLPKAVRALYVFERRYADMQPQLLESNLLTAQSKSQGDAWSAAASVFRYTASQMVRMHSGELQKSRYDAHAHSMAQSVGAHQEFWSFEPFIS